jgi:hypothetical protein
MKSNFLYGSILAAALSVGVGAQAPTAAPQDPASPQPSREQQQPMAKSSESVTVTGCIQPDTAAPTGTSGSATSPAGGASSKAESFILANVSSGSGGGAAAGTAGTAGAGAPTASQYKLSGKSDDLKKYVNSKVEIKGKVDSGSGAAASSSPTLRVDSVKQVSPSCSQ